MRCRNCGNELPNGAVFCKSCGVATGKGNKFCSNCGKDTNPEADYCLSCGVNLTGMYKSQLVAGLLGIFLGELGIHRFYLGYIGIGIVQIIVTLFTFGIGGLWGFIEGILILTGNFNRDAQGKPLQKMS